MTYIVRCINVYTCGIYIFVVDVFVFIVSFYDTDGLAISFEWSLSPRTQSYLPPQSSFDVYGIRLLERSVCLEHSPSMGPRSFSLLLFISSAASMYILVVYTFLLWRHSFSLSVLWYWWWPKSIVLAVYFEWSLSPKTQFYLPRQSTLDV